MPTSNVNAVVASPVSSLWSASAIDLAQSGLARPAITADCAISRAAATIAARGGVVSVGDWSAAVIAAPSAASTAESLAEPIAEAGTLLNAIDNSIRFE